MADSESTKSPAFQFYPADFVHGTLLLSTEEVGAYILLLCHCWDRGSIPSDISLLARIARLSPAKMRRVWLSVSGKFREVDGALVQPRLEKERQKQLDYRKRQSDAAAKRWQSQATPAASIRDASGISRNDALQSSVSSLQSSSSDFSQVQTDSRSKRPIFKGQRFVVFDWMLADLSRMLGNHADGFDLHAWFYTLDQQAVDANVVVPQRDGGKWLQERTHEEALRRGLPIAVQTHNPKTAGNLAAAARFVARGQR